MSRNGDGDILEMFLPVFSALTLMMKLPKPLKYTFSPDAMTSFTVSMKFSTTEDTAPFSMPVLLAMIATISALVISFTFNGDYFVCCKFAGKGTNIFHTENIYCHFFLSNQL